MTTVTISKELADALIPIIDNRIYFIQNKLYLNPGPLGKQLKILKEFFPILEKISCENTRPDNEFELPPIDPTPTQIPGGIRRKQ